MVIIGYHIKLPTRLMTE